MNSMTCQPEIANFDPKDLRDTFGQFATGVTVITTIAENGAPVGLAANSFTSISLDPALVAWSLALTAPSLSAFRNHGHFAINILCEDSVDLAMNFSRPSDNKFADVNWCHGVNDVPVLTRAATVIECETVNQIPGGDHVIFIGSVKRYKSVAGKSPLLFHKGAFARIGEIL
ncbi:flavin reductase family protein [Pelagimonas varians]|uniref:p-hydroxyphenylacetate 3-hydroxylase, reductase component n=1 Tax=Pelagimonas varians TaxID=696760 RepID=A0A238KAJ5_9RHOB|nr:flavin reductase family protein [Pelagimonas varians]PYG31020.1 flavin reductase (DIM6/NTAB) family NADH-FMN oxidoreductase RutF [Pelagimonas varians]SMX39444.1 p-hydroxyphenylacetate 3-hydroxylase, reductase component [Pelagimonas varians]